MALHTSREFVRDISKNDSTSLIIFPTTSQLQTPEQIRRFELLRLAFFALKLRKLEQHPVDPATVTNEQTQERAFQSNLLRHVIFQQVLTLIQLDAREQALQIINACQK